MLPPVTKEWQTFRSDDDCILQLKLGRTKKIIGRWVRVTPTCKYYDHTFVVADQQLSFIKVKMIYRRKSVKRKVAKS